jgi:hypothetical protein
MLERCARSLVLRLFEISGMFMRFDNRIRFIENVNHCGM